MSLRELRDYFTGPWAFRLPFSDEEMSEPLLMAYGIVSVAVRDDCTVIEVSPERVTWKKENGTIAGEFHPPVSFKPYFQLIMKRDQLLQTHLRLVEETEIIAVYHILR